MRMFLRILFAFIISLPAFAAWEPISRVVPQYVDASGDPYSGAVLKFYTAGTSTNIPVATDSTGGTQATSVALNSNGYPEVSGTIVIPHIDQDYKIALYPTQAAADSDTGAIYTVDNVSTTAVAPAEWQETSLTPTYVSATQFTLSGDQTTIFHVGRRLRIVDSGGTDYATITASSYSSPDTTITVAVDGGGSLDAGISTVNYSILSADNLSIPAIIPAGATVNGDIDMSGFNIGFDDATGIEDDSGNEQLIFQKNASAVNYIEIENAATGNDVILRATGSDANVGINIITKGSGALTVNDGGLFAAVPNHPVLSNDTDTDHDILISAGSKLDYGALFIITNTAITKQIDAAWAVGDDAGGLDGTESVAGTPDADTWYYVYTIIDNDTNTVDAIFSETAPSSGPTLPTGYDDYAHVGHVLTDGSANVIQFTQYGASISWDVPQTIFASKTDLAAASGGGELIDTFSPPGVNCLEHINGYAIRTSSNSRTSQFAFSPSATMQTAIGYAYITSVSEDSEASQDPMTGATSVPTNTGQILFATEQTATDSHNAYSMGFTCFY